MQDGLKWTKWKSRVSDPEWSGQCGIAASAIVPADQASCGPLVDPSKNGFHGAARGCALIYLGSRCCNALCSFGPSDELLMVAIWSFSVFLPSLRHNAKEQFIPFDCDLLINSLELGLLCLDRVNIRQCLAVGLMFGSTHVSQPKACNCMKTSDLRSNPRGTAFISLLPDTRVMEHQIIQGHFFGKCFIGQRLAHRTCNPSTVAETDGDGAKMPARHHKLRKLEGVELSFCMH